MNKAREKEPGRKRDEALVERLFRRMLESMGGLVDRKLGRADAFQGQLTTSTLIERMKRLIDERVRDGGGGGGSRGRIAPHLLKLKIEWGTHSEAPPESVQELEHEILAAAIDHINDHRYQILAPVKVETTSDIFTTGITVDPTFGEFEETLQQEDAARQRSAEGKPALQTPAGPQDVPIAARVIAPDGTREIRVVFKPGGRRLSVGRATDNDLHLNHSSVSKVHAALVMNREGTLLVADTGSTNGTYINGRRIAYGEARPLEDGDVIGFGDIEVRFRKVMTQTEQESPKS